MSRKLLLALSLLLIMPVISLAQNTPKPDQKAVSAELKKEAIDFLRETSTEVNNMRTLENRISFSAELASLMWFADEKEARQMFQTAINDFRQLFVQYDNQINALGITPTDERIYARDGNSISQLNAKFMKAVAVRQQVATAISEHDPKLALEFFYDTSMVITNAEFKKQIADRDVYFETRLLQQIAEKDIDTALEYGKKSLEKGVNYETFSLLNKIYEKDQDKGISFGELVLSKVKSDVSKPDSFYLIDSLLNSGISSYDQSKETPGKKPILSQDSLRQLAELLAQNILNREDGEGENFAGYIKQIERFAPSRAAQIRQKFKIKQPKNITKTITADASVDAPPPPAVGEDADEKLFDSNAAQLSKADREKSIAAARQRISQLKDANQKLLGLNQLAIQIYKLGDKDAALQLLEESRAMMNFPPKNYQDFMKVWVLASGYSQIDAEKSFPILEDAIFRLNDTVSAFIKVGEFIDTNGEMIEDGEVQVGSFGGEISRELLRNLGATDTTILSLAVANFARTRALTNKFDRPETRILAKMLVLRGVLGESKIEN